MVLRNSLAPTHFDGSTFFNDSEDRQVTAAVATGTDGTGSYPLVAALPLLVAGVGTIVVPATSNKKPASVTVTVSLKRPPNGVAVPVTLTVSADAGGPMIGTVTVSVAKRSAGNYRVRLVGHHVTFDGNGNPSFTGIRTDFVDVAVP